jgi:hypothetical protein
MLHCQLWLQGTQLSDLRLTRNIMTVLIPDAMIVCSISNESNTDDDIATLGQRLADEVARYVDSIHCGSAAVCAPN